jgi:uncharacterized membrane protein HdeD (DUF308 family)
MVTDTAARTPVERMLQEKAARWWWVPLIAAGAWVVIGWMVLRADYASLVAVGVLVGLVLVMAAINEGAMVAAVSGGWKVLHIVLAVFFGLGALWAFIRPINTFFALASVLGLLLFLEGIVTLTRGIALKDETPHWWLDLVSGGLFILLAIWVSSSDRIWDLAERAAFILLWVGIMAIFRAISDVMLAFSLRRMGKEGPSPEPAAEPSPAIPRQERRAPAATDVPETTAP